ncbi:MAG: alkaline phosphatase family protein [Bacteroidia bacterium]|nr:alkaline phosphatase family protein [Bacteroidia bacterium]
MKKMIFTLLVLCLTLGNTATLLAQSNLLQSGPMVGYSGMREVMLWVQTKESAQVKIEYWVKGKKGNSWFTDTETTKHKDGFTAHLLCDQVMPGNQYVYALYINDEKVDISWDLAFESQALWQYRTEPPAVRFAIGSCHYVNDAPFDRPGDPYGGNYEIMGSIFNQKPQFMVWLGDNVYLREADWDTRTGIYYRYTHTRSQPEMQPLLGSVHHYATWDDHDFGPNDADRSYIHKDWTLAAFKDFWANSSYGIEGGPGVTGQFTWSDLDFFLLDDRYFRSPNERVTGEPTIIGETQLQWIIDALKGSKAPFKFVCIGGQVLNTAPVYENYINVAPEERKKLLDAIKREQIKGVIFLTGDRHHTELTRLTTDDKIDIYDLTVSPLTSTSYDSANEANLLRVKGTYVSQRNFAMLDVTGTRKERVLKITVYSSTGQELWTQSINGF